MPKGLTIAEVIDKNKITSDRVWLYALKIYVTDINGVAVEELNLVNNSEDATIDGDTYIAFPFTLEKSSSESDLGSLSVSVQDQTGLVQTRLQAYQGLVGREVDVILTLTDAGTANASTNTDLVERYQIVNTGSSNYTVNFDLGSDNPLNNIVPAGVQSKDRCRWRYKSAECKYVGGLGTCDFTLDGANGCTAHANEENFGGYRGITVRG